MQVRAFYVASPTFGIDESLTCADALDKSWTCGNSSDQYRPIPTATDPPVYPARTDTEWIMVERA